VEKNLSEFEVSKAFPATVQQLHLGAIDSFFYSSNSFWNYSSAPCRRFTTFGFYNSNSLPTCTKSSYQQLTRIPEPR
jgi:hypothetical protein